MKIYVARHGRSNYNDLKLFNSDPSIDVHLTDYGIHQAENLAEKLKAVTIEHIFVSELKRTQQTADIVNKYHNAPVSAEAILNDHRSGFEGQSYEEYDKLFNSSENKWTDRFGDGESLDDTRVRMQEFLTKLKKEKYDSVLIVTSMTIVQAIHGVIKHLSDDDTWKINVETGSYTEFIVI
ncbi:histidine phosphatase family protein [Microbacteriaceae bacterium]|nr:histidine phosphatase family protein [Candidatus Saccharibacteria bacterium]